MLSYSVGFFRHFRFRMKPHLHPSITKQKKRMHKEAYSIESTKFFFGYGQTNISVDKLTEFLSSLQPEITSVNKKSSFADKYLLDSTERVSQRILETRLSKKMDTRLLPLNNTTSTVLYIRESSAKSFFTTKQSTPHA